MGMCFKTNIMIAPACDTLSDSMSPVMGTLTGMHLALASADSPCPSLPSTRHTPCLPGGAKLC